MGTQEATRRANFLYTVLTLQSPKFLEKNGIEHCKNCGGSGLGNINKLASGDYTWDGSTYCSECAGTGYIGFMNKVLQLEDGTFICKYCLGDGCSTCNHTGKLDWIKHAMGGK